MASIFTKIINREIPAQIIAEDDRHIAFLDIMPLVHGHVLVIPKREVDYIFDLEPNELAALWQFAQRVAVGLKLAVPCKRIGTAVIGLEVPHAHIHLVPMQTVGDINFTKEKLQPTAEQLSLMAASIQAQL